MRKQVEERGETGNLSLVSNISFDSFLPSFTLKLTEWFSKNGRDLPWRKTRDPYKILISEIMLQQTNVDIVIPIYIDFLVKFPTIQSLANAKLDEIKRITDRLGYKRRGKFLYEIAQQIVKEKSGQIPDTLEELLTLKGIGRYTAGAILSFAFERSDPSAAIVDVNVERVLSRITGIWAEKRNSDFNKTIWILAESILSSGEVWKVNQGILDLGATICISKKPKCSICPMIEICSYYAEEYPKHIPLDSFLGD